jgi:hypothetical protein
VCGVSVAAFDTARFAEIDAEAHAVLFWFVLFALITSVVGISGSRNVTFAPRVAKITRLIFIDLRH